MMLNEILNRLKMVEAKPYYVGGYVRDYILGKHSTDYDIEVHNITFNELVNVLSEFGSVVSYDRFCVAKLKNLSNVEFAIPRIEKKNGKLHTDFEITICDDLTIKEAAIRRDFTVNAIYMDPFTNKVVDPYNGIKDIKNKNLRHISLKFCEDSLRVLRAIRFSSKLGFKITDKTLELCKGMLNDLDYVSSQRFSSEFYKTINGKYLKNSYSYIKILLFKYFGIVNVEELKFYNASSTDLKIVLFFYMIRRNDIDMFLNKCVLKKSLQKKIKFLNTTKFHDYYSMFECFRKDGVEIYEIVCGVDGHKLFDFYQVLKDKYCASYFLDVGISKTKLSATIKNTINREIAFLVNKNSSNWRV